MPGYGLIFFFPKQLEAQEVSLVERTRASWVQILKLPLSVSKSLVWLIGGWKLPAPDTQHSSDCSVVPRLAGQGLRRRRQRRWESETPGREFISDVKRSVILASRFCWSPEASRSGGARARGAYRLQCWFAFECFIQRALSSDLHQAHNWGNTVMVSLPSGLMHSTLTIIFQVCPWGFSFWIVPGEPCVRR